MQVDPKALIRRLTPTATAALEAAVGRASSGQYYEIVPEHLLLTLLARDDGEAALLLAQHGCDRDALLLEIERALTRMRTGNAGRPMFARTLFDWLEDAWLLTSVEHGATALRSGALLAAFALDAAKYSAESYAALARVPREALRVDLYDALSATAEARELTAAPARGAADTSRKHGAEAEALAKFTVSFTDEARAGKIDPVFGRHREIRQMIDILSRRRKNNPIIVGEPGVGKTALVEGLARAVVEGDVPEALRDVAILGLDLGALQAGAGVRGEFEGRLKAVISAVKASPTPIILFIDEAHTLIGAGGPQGGSDAANLLKPELARGSLRTIAATTWSEYKRYFEKDAALERRFQPVKVDEPSEAEAVTMLRGLSSVYEKAHGVALRDEAVLAAVQLSRRYIAGRQLPDKAVDLLDSVAARTKSEVHAKPEALAALEAELTSLENTACALERDRAQGFAPDERETRAVHASLEETRARLHATRTRWQAERDAALRVIAVREASRDAGCEADASALEAAKRALDEARAGSEPLVHLEADRAAVARVVQSWTGIPVGKLQSSTLQNVLALESLLQARVRGQDHALKVVAETIRMAKSGLANPDAPLGVLLFVGPSGVGKTETALALADVLYGGDRFLTTVNMSEYQEKHSVSRLVGSPPGYVGYGQGGVLTEAVRQRPYSVVLLDECEKADLEVMNLFYQVFDKGTLADGEGRKIDFRNTIVILTSNLATDEIARMHEDGAAPSPEDVTARIQPILSRHFKPALLARMTVVPYAPMGTDVLRQIAALRLDKLSARLREAHGTELVLRPAFLEQLVQRCRASESGARNIDHILRGGLMPALSRHLLEGMLGARRPEALVVDCDERGDLTVTPRV
ncbi:MAG: type VI secretion system ATPase TssH [Polyangiales bacterium]